MLNNKLIILSGTDQKIKAAWANKYNLSDFVLSPDDIRSRCFKNQMTPEIDALVWTYLLRMMSIKLANGVPIVLDVSASTKLDFINYANIAKQYRYKAVCIDFTKTSIFKQLDKKLKKHTDCQYLTYIQYPLRQTDLPQGIDLIKQSQFNKWVKK